MMHIHNIRKRSAFILMTALGVLAILVIVATSASAAWRVSYRNTANVERRIQELMLQQAALQPVHLMNLEDAEGIIVQLPLSKTALGDSFIVASKETIAADDPLYQSNGVTHSEGDWLVTLSLYRGKPEARQLALSELPPADKPAKFLWNANKPDRPPLPMIGK